jgi:glycerol-1-phosphatase
VLVLVDLDGVVYRGADGVPGVGAVLAARVAQGDTVVYVTNNAANDRRDYVPRLEGHGAPVFPDCVVTSASAAASYVAAELPAVRRVLAVGTAGLEHELREAGLEAVPVGEAASRMASEGIDGWEAAGRPQAVVVGLDPEMTYLRIAAAADCVRAGAVLVATNRDPMIPTETGFLPGAGTVVAAIETASRSRAIVTIGKPGPTLLVEAARGVGLDPRGSVMIGDSVTDVQAGVAVGARTILVLTGVTSRAMADALPTADRPTLVCADAAELAEGLARLAAG